jgi:hypothetical protein
MSAGALWWIAACATVYVDPDAETATTVAISLSLVSFFVGFIRALR